MPTPVTPSGLRQFDNLEPAQAVIKAWSTPGPHPGYHAAMQQQVRAAMPVLARALDRLADHV